VPGGNKARSPANGPSWLAGGRGASAHVGAWLRTSNGVSLASATAATVRLLRLARGTATREELWRVARAWQGVFESDALSASFVARRDALEANFRVQGLEAALAQDLTQLFAGLLADTLAEDPEGEEPPLITAAKDALQSDWLGELESLAEELPTDKSNRLDGYSRHWHTWAHLRALARRYLDAIPERRTAVYDAIGPTLLNHGAWLHNSAEGVLLAHDIFRYLLTLSPPTTQDYATLKKNAAIGKSL
ncbi:MAG TPA: hypothetical protein VMS65_15330, partial [Polyangiaceae bacterium]|nr:hypothetical protein [Polyangiaceae bacterium]